jgi:MraZ protein
MTRGMHGCLWIFGEEEWREFQKTLTPKSPFDNAGLKLERIFVGSAVECTTDLQGRVPIPQNLRDIAGITDEIWVVGVGAKVEIWSKQRWDAFNEEYSDDAIEALGAAMQVALA